MEQNPGTQSALRQDIEALERENLALKAALQSSENALKEARATLVSSAAYIKRVYQDSPVPIVIIDPAIGIVDCNLAAVRIYGFSSRDEVLGEEGCLSIPNLVGDVWRAQWLTIKGLDGDGKEVRIKAADWLARAFQHEIAHLNVRLFAETATEIRRLVRTEDGVMAVPLDGSGTSSPGTPVIHSKTPSLG